MSLFNFNVSKLSFASVFKVFLFRMGLSCAIQVFSNIRFLAIIVGSITLFSSPVLHAQGQDTEQAETSIVEPTAETKQPAILRLEDTIRGNKEQPQVLTIVPWQLPIHQRINENSEWQLQATQLASIERNAFLRNLAVVNELNRAQAKPLLRSEAASDDN